MHRRRNNGCMKVCAPRPWLPLFRIEPLSNPHRHAATPLLSSTPSLGSKANKVEEGLPNTRCRDKQGLEVREELLEKATRLRDYEAVLHCGWSSYETRWPETGEGARTG